MPDTSSVKKLLEAGVVEIKFARRRPKKGQNSSRRMLATNNKLLLSSLEGAVAFKFSPPSQAPKYNASAHGLVIAYDLLKLDFRAIPANASNVLSFRPITNEEELKEFWQFFGQELAPMSSEDKEKFINS
jgi:hypothetical protein